jgi:hypothetical protein
MEHLCGSDMYQLDANCLVKKPKYVTMPGAEIEGSTCCDVIFAECYWLRLAYV